jgi:hypothetical protein
VDSNGDAVRTARAYLAIVLGPSVGAARAKVMFAIDGLEVKVWGKREGVKRDRKGDGNEETTGGDRSGSENEEDEEDGSEDEEPIESDMDSESEDESDHDDDEVSDPDPQPHQPTHAETEQILHTSSRLLARTLASHQPEFHTEGGDTTWMAQELGTDPLSHHPYIFSLIYEG